MATFATKMIKFIRSLINKYYEQKEKSHFPEREFIVEFDDEKIICRHPDGSIEKLIWKEFTKFEVHTNSFGPFVEDVYFILHGNDTGCCIPQGGTNVSELLQKLYKLPGFKNETFAKAMCSTEDNIFIIWEK